MASRRGATVAVAALWLCAAVERGEAAQNCICECMRLCVRTEIRNMGECSGECKEKACTKGCEEACTRKGYPKLPAHGLVSCENVDAPPPKDFSVN